MEYIENFANPQIGDFYLVRTVTFLRKGNLFSWPVIDKIHKDLKEDNLNENDHYHIDWRFMPENILLEHRIHNQNIWEGWKNYENAEFLSPIMGSEKISENYEKWKYLRDFGKTIEPSYSLKEKFRNIKMKNMRCPHHGTNLISCKIVSKKVTCPNHGLIWNTETNKLVD